MKRIITIMAVFLLLIAAGCGQSQEAKYEAAQKLLAEGKYSEAAEKFDQLPGFNEASKYSIYSKALEAAKSKAYDDAITTLKSLDDFADASFYTVYFTAEQLALSGEYEKLLEAKRLYESIPLFQDSKDKVKGIDDSIAKMYNEAKKLLADGQYSEAAGKFYELAGYENAFQYYRYSMAIGAGINESYDSAITTLSALGDFEEASLYITYFTAEQLNASGEYDKLVQAKELFESILLFQDSADKVIGIDDSIEKMSEVYKEAKILLTDGLYSEAAEKFDEISSFSDALQYSLYAEALEFIRNGSIDYAITAFTDLGDFADASSYATYLTAEQLEANGDYESLVQAKALYENISQFLDSEEKIKRVDEKMVNVIYSSAEQLAASGEYNKLVHAKELYESIPLFGNSKDKVLEIDIEIKEMEAHNPFLSAKVGALVEYGRYEQDGDLSNGPEPILWRVLSKEDSGTLVISEYCLARKKYNQEAGKITWENCTLRQWLNSEFYDTAFTAEEKEHIVLRHNINSSTDLNGGADTDDYIFLLSSGEISKYFPKRESRIAYPTQYAGNKSYYNDWWLRSPFKVNAAELVSHDGSDNKGGYVENYYYVRPAFLSD